MLTLATFKNVSELPVYIRGAMQYNIERGCKASSGIAKAERKQMLQNGIVRAIREQEIDLELGREILIRWNAYGPKGKAALKGFE